MPRPTLPIVLIHLGWPVPEHLGACIAQIRLVTGSDPLVVGPREGAALRSPALTRFRRKEQLSHFGLDGFWRYAAERFLVLEAFMRSQGLDRCLHLESDNLLYVAPAVVGPWLESRYGTGVATCPLVVDEDTAAIMYVGSLDELTRFNDALVELVALGGRRLLRTHGGSTANEMRMLHILRTDLGLASALPTTLDEAQAMGSAWVFDPASYGQCVDGIPANPGVRYVGDHHIPGRELIAGRCDVAWVDGAPEVRSTSASLPLVNLHLHSKRLARYLPDATDITLPALRPPRRRDGALAARMRRIHGRLVP
ncbi:MAG: hypothetical protein QOG68_1306 [Solirubrobacteraceae bacterium]|nr:hypothetical protein [Solirubrobacteraceae bacterium]